jgi:hypothetical protein
MLGGCATAPSFDTEQAPPVELTAVPFYPQTEYQCGPAALATVLSFAGVPTDADALVPEVYTEGLRGSLQAELLAATRRHQRIPYVLEPQVDALAAELGAGRPVLVLQNLGLPRVPVWHYAVVVGLDPERGRVILRSGTEQRREERAARFLRSWSRGEHWAFVVLEPGELPATAEPGAYVRALAGASRFLSDGGADAAFASALERWPDDELVLFAAAGRELESRDWPQAEALYRRLLGVAPANTAARNNLANVLAERGCNAAALTEARAALAATPPGDPLHAAIADTVATLQASATPSSASCL